MIIGYLDPWGLVGIGKFDLLFLWLIGVVSISLGRYMGVP